MEITGWQLHEQHRAFQEHLRQIGEGMTCMPGCLCERDAAVADFLLRRMGFDPVVVSDEAWDDLADFLGFEFDEDDL